MKETKNDKATGSGKETEASGENAYPSPEDPHYSLVSTSDSSAGAIGFDDLGQPRWTWITELGGGAELTPEDTFDYLKALDNETLSLADDAGVQPADESSPGGYDPYDTARINLKGRFGRR